MTENPHIAAEKKLLRKQVAAARRQAFDSHGKWAADQLALVADTLRPPPGAVVAGYWPMEGEIDPIPLMLRFAGQGCALALPVVVERGHRLTFRAWSPGDALEPGHHGTFHPPPTAAEIVPSLVLVPLLAFDRQGFRLGFGGGYYDRTLESLRANAHLTTIGIGFAAQEVPAVPHDGHDQRLDAVATENGLITVDQE